MVPRHDPSTVRTILIYAQDTRGLGHITRARALAEKIVRAHENVRIYIATRSKLVSVELPDRCDFIKLPNRISPFKEEETEEEMETARAQFRGIRSRILRETAVALNPDLVIVDHEPLGSKGEFRDGLYALKRQNPSAKFVFGMRDIMDDPGTIRRAWETMGVYDAFENLYDGIAVYGSKAVYDVASAYEVPHRVRNKFVYCGYVVRELPATDRVALRRRLRLPADRPIIAATVGSGSDGFAILNAVDAASGMLRRHIPGLFTVMVTGPFMPIEQRQLLLSRARESCAVLEQADNPAYMAAADAVVSMGGYNSVFEALAIGRPLVIVPRATHKVEQRIRAETLASLGMTRCVPPESLTPANLADAMQWAMTCDQRGQAAESARVLGRFDGAARLSEYLSQWIGGE